MYQDIPNIFSMHQYTSPNLKVVENTLKNVYGISHTGQEHVVELCNIVAVHAAHLAGAGIVAILK
jgi:hypothetical protein